MGAEEGGWGGGDLPDRDVSFRCRCKLLGKIFVSVVFLMSFEGRNEPNDYFFLLIAYLVLSC